MRLVPQPYKRPLTSRERLMAEYTTWNENGRPVLPTSRILAGMYATLYRRRYKLLPVSPVQDDIEAFDGLLRILAEDIALTPWCIEVLFSLKEFNVKAAAFSNPNVIDKWDVVERASKLRSKNGRGEQAEFKSDRKHYGVIRA